MLWIVVEINRKNTLKAFFNERVKGIRAKKAEQQPQHQEVPEEKKEVEDKTKEEQKPEPSPIKKTDESSNTEEGGKEAVKIPPPKGSEKMKMNLEAVNAEHPFFQKESVDPSTTKAGDTQANQPSEGEYNPQRQSFCFVYCVVKTA